MNNGARKAKLWPWSLASTIVLLTVFVAAYAYSVGITNRDLKARLTRAVLQQKERDHEAAAAFVDQERRAKEEARQEVATELEELRESNRELKARLSQAESNAKPPEKRDAEHRPAAQGAVAWLQARQSQATSADSEPARDKGPCIVVIDEGWIHPYELTKGKSYQVSKKIALMPAFEPADPLEAIRRIKYLARGSCISILEIRKKRNTPWYRVKAYSSKGDYIDRGWVNCIALAGDFLIKEVRIGDQ